MGLREEIRSGLVGLLASVTDAAHTLRHGDGESGQVAQTSSRDFSLQEVSDESPAEVARFVADASAFPTLAVGKTVELDETFRVVVSLNQDAVGATFSVGLSAPFESAPATYAGKRRTDSTTYTLSIPIDVLFVENGVADNSTYAEAPTYAASYTLAIRRDDWQDGASDPEVADTIEMTPRGSLVSLKVSSVTRHDGWYILKCRTKG